MNDERLAKIDKAESMLDKVKAMLDEFQQSEIIYNKLPDPVETVEDVALIQCFYGTDIARIRATTQALEFNLQMTKKPSTWIFVECQRSKTDCAFQWLKTYGVKYVFVQMKPENEGIMLKHPLWNIGVENCIESKLCFVDSDVVMCNSDWIGNSSSELDSCDIISLASHQYCQADDNCSIYETIGHEWSSNGKVSTGHVGFTFGLTREAFNIIGGFEPAIILDDIQTWWKIMGDDTFRSFRKWTEPFELPARREFGFNLKVGYSDNIACHVWHGDDHGKYSSLTNLIKFCGIRHSSDIIDYDWKQHNSLPRWKQDIRCKVLKDVVVSYYKYMKENELNQDVELKFDIVEEYKKSMQGILGHPDDRHPLFICSTVKNRFGLNLDDFIEFRNKVEEKFNAVGVNPVVVFFTDAKMDFKSNDINAYPLKSYNKLDESAQCMRKDLKFPKDAVVYFIPFGLSDFNSTIWIPESTTRFMDGSVLIRL